ncbi:neuroligin-4, X-linked-like isoform X2 [Argiope bruennichi]|uniref:neuroligin-4, X-linked-like isoform X2 n=1 Tax=Argiope bruennichi TaxID=94029 RepID=UPI0024945902|nr:neuroligin-4, X-linked-like isoform X2 [Argiope bruennichi]
MKLLALLRGLRFFYLLGVVLLPVLYGISRAEMDKNGNGQKKSRIIGDHLVSAGKPKTRIVATKYGELRGFIATLPNKHLQAIEVYLGVPYASPPVSALRFMPPVTPAHWKGVKTVDHYGPVCPQKLPNIKNETEALKRMPAGRLEILKRLLPHLTNQSEDCLYLNIYAPQRSGRNNSRVPVFVFIHGESFEWNAGNPYDGSVLASFGNVVVVTVNFRLGVLGFLPVMEGSARGNYGLTDQVAALHWIQENIAEFGGDPQNVTLFGHGHGAACVNFLVLSPMSRAGLFHRAIMMSGSALSPWAIARDANLYAQQIGRTVGCPTNQPAKLLECLRQRSVKDILRVDISVPMFLTGFGPTIDGIVIQNEPSTMMEELVNEHKFGMFDLMFGVTRVESYFQISEKEEKDGLSIERRDKLLRTLVRNIFNFHLQEIFLTIVNEYTDWTKAIQHDINVLDNTLDALGDALVVAPMVRSANYHSMSQRRSFFYVFNYQTEDGKFPQRQGCVSGEDLQFVFGAPLVRTLGHFKKNYTQQEVVLSEAIMTYWVNFAKYGDPNPLPSEKPQDRTKGRYERTLWPKYDNIHQKYLLLAGTKPRVRDHYHAHRLSFWLNLFPQLHASTAATVSPEHHLLDDHDNLQSYDGAVRQVPFSLSKTAADAATHAPTTSTTTTSKSTSASTLLSSIQPYYQVPTENVTMPVTTVNTTDAPAVVMTQSSFNAALSVTIAVGASLLILNALIFAGIYYQRDRTRAEEILKKRILTQKAIDATLEAAAVVNLKSATLRAPPPSPVCQTMQQQELTLHPPPQKLNHPHKTLPKPCMVPCPPQIQKESLADVQALVNQGVATMTKKAPAQQFRQNAQVHQSHSNDVKL